MDFSLHEQRTLARIEEELSEDRRLAALLTVLDAERPKRFRRLRILGLALRHPRSAALPGVHHKVDTRPLLAVTILLTIACVAVLVASIVLGIGTLIVVSCAVLPLLPTLGAIVYFRVRPRRRRR
ncbi:MAG TPA: hypothetical protein VHV74_21715 [Pseudonocardiaceae bacterium]|jgi:hypothetical protein|nr:hypothetical protein [Pseudonocardiaceae bacterium]